MLAVQAMFWFHLRTIVTKGDGSIGLNAQSVGGGGGAAGSVTNSAASGDVSVAGSATLSFGGSGGDGGPAGDVTFVSIHSPFAPEISTLGPALVLTASSSIHRWWWWSRWIHPLSKSPPPHPTLTSPWRICCFWWLWWWWWHADRLPGSSSQIAISISPPLVTPLMVSSFNPLVVVAVQVVPSPGAAGGDLSPTSPLAPLAVTAVQQRRSILC